MGTQSVAEEITPAEAVEVEAVLQVPTILIVGMMIGLDPIGLCY